MKRLCTLLYLLAAAAIPRIAAEPEATFLSEIYDFGAFDENDGTVSCEFRYVNTGDEPLVIVASRATCGCTSSDYTKSPVEPGDTGIVVVKYNPIGRPGRFSKKVYVDFNSERPRHTLLIKGVVIGSSNTLRGRYPVDAGMLKLRNNTLMMGDVVMGKGKSAFFEVYNATGDSLTPQWENLPDALKVNTPTPTIPPGEQATYTFYLTPNGGDMYGIYTDTLTLRPTPASEPIPVDLVAIINEDFSRLTPGQRQNAPAIYLNERMVDFDIIDPNAGPVTGSFTITNQGKNPLLLRRVYTTDPGVTVTSSTDKIKKGKSATITVTVDPLAIPSEILNARISIISNDPVNPTVVMRAVGQLR